MEVPPACPAQASLPLCLPPPQAPPDWSEILTYFRGSELQNYFQRVRATSAAARGRAVAPAAPAATAAAAAAARAAAASNTSCQHGRAPYTPADARRLPSCGFACPLCDTPVDRGQATLCLPARPLSHRCWRTTSRQSSSRSTWITSPRCDVLRCIACACRRGRVHGSPVQGVRAHVRVPRRSGGGGGGSGGGAAAFCECCIVRSLALYSATYFNPLPALPGGARQRWGGDHREGPARREGHTPEGPRPGAGGWVPPDQSIN
mgnify:CR=1 FL=1